MMTRTTRAFGRIALSTLLAAVSTLAAAQAKPPQVFDVWVKATVPGGRVSAAYMHIKSATPTKLVKVEADIAEVVEIHDMKMRDGVMEMKAIDAVDVPANKLVDLKPGGMHVMLVKVKQPIKKGDKVPLKLTFNGADGKPVVVNVDAIGAEKDRGGHRH